MLGLNTRRGDSRAGDNGLSAVPGREAEARAAIDEAIAYAGAIGTPNIHVMAGFAQGEDAHRVFVKNLDHACAAAAALGITILIETLNRYDAPGYFLTTTGQALAIMEAVGRPNLKLMFDCYHVQLMEGDLSHRIAALLPSIGHIEIASVPVRGPPDHGEVNHAHICALIERLGYGAPLGAEHKPKGSTEETLVWMRARPKRLGFEMGTEAASETTTSALQWSTPFEPGPRADTRERRALQAHSPDTRMVDRSRSAMSK